jgi:uncharacterized protein (TIGR00369 family)
MEHYRKLERMYSKAPINKFFRPQLTIGEGTAEIRIPVRDDFHHTAGAMHGSVYFKALDDATFFAANSLITDVFVLTASFEIEFLRPVVDGEIKAIAQVTGQNERRIMAEAELFDSNDNIVGRGRGQFAKSRIQLTSQVQYV